MAIEIGGMQASLEEIVEAIDILSSYKDSTAIKQHLKKRDNPLAGSDYHTVVRTYLQEHPDRRTPTGSSEKHAPRARKAFIEALAEKIVSNDLDPEVTAAGIMFITPAADIDDYEVQEGKFRLCLHRIRERKQSLAQHKKDAVMQSQGYLACEVCSFNFKEVYGTLGQGFIEAHHIVPLAQAGRSVSKLTDLALVCSNCHRMLHRSIFNSKILTPEDLRHRLTKAGNDQ